MKAIYLLRHAKSSWKDDSLDDFDRPLSKRGRRAASRMAEYMVQQGIEPAQILCSSAKRTRETLKRMGKLFGAATPTRFEKGIYMADAPALLRRLRRLSDSLASVMVIGHNPGLEDLARLLVSDCAGDAGVRSIEKFQTAALAVLASEIEHWQDLKPASAGISALVAPKDLDAA